METVNKLLNYFIMKCIDYNNVNLNDSYERDQNIIDPLSFDTLLLEVHCNIKDELLTPKAIIAQFEEDLQNKITSAREIIKANAHNLYLTAIAERKE